MRFACQLEAKGVDLAARAIGVDATLRDWMRIMTENLEAMERQCPDRSCGPVAIGKPSRAAQSQTGLQKHPIRKIDGSV